jgi:hypothetical protein
VFHPKFEPDTFRKTEALSLEPTFSGVAKKREIGWPYVGQHKENRISLTLSLTLSTPS